MPDIEDTSNQILVEIFWVPLNVSCAEIFSIVSKVLLPLTLMSLHSNGLTLLAKSHSLETEWGLFNGTTLSSIMKADSHQSIMTD